MKVMEIDDLFLNGVPNDPSTLCPWQSIHLIGYRVPPELRWDAVGGASDFLDFRENLLDIFNGLKMEVMVNRHTLVKAAEAVDPTKLEYFGWNTSVRETFQGPNGTSRPLSAGFAISYRHLGNSLVAMSIALFTKQRTPWI